jgi:hypothetical protein
MESGLHAPCSLLGRCGRRSDERCCEDFAAIILVLTHDRVAAPDTPADGFVRQTVIPRSDNPRSPG